MKAIFEFNPSTSMITGSNAVCISMPGIEPFEEPEDSKVSDIIKLKNAGFTAQEIIEIVKSDLL